MTDRAVQPMTDRLREWTAERKALLGRLLISASFLGLFVFSCIRAAKSGDKIFAVGYGVLFLLSLIGVFAYRFLSDK